MSKDKPKTIEVKQRQTLNVANDIHGMTDSIPCPYADYHVSGLPDWLNKEAMSNNIVKILIAKSKVERVFCHYLCNNGCSSSKNENSDKRCFILQAL